MATTYLTARLRAGAWLLGLRVSVALVVKGTTVAFHLGLRLSGLLIVIHLRVCSSYPDLSAGRTRSSGLGPDGP